MAFKLPRLLAGLSGRIGARRGQSAAGSRRSLLAPRWLVSVDARMVEVTYRIHLSWTGRRSLLAATMPAGEPFYLVLHPSLPFRRKLQCFPANAKARKVLLRTAPDEFPLAEGTVSFCLGLREDEGYVYALPSEINEQLQRLGRQPDFVLVGCSDTLDEADCLATLAAYERFGSSLAFGDRLPPVHRHWLLDVPLAASAAVALALTVWLTSGADPLAEILGGEEERLRRETATVAGQYAAAESMLTTRNQLSRLYESPGAHLPAKLARLWRDVPAGQAIRRIEYKEGHLTVTGSGIEVGKWLESAGFAPERITTETVGKLNRFRAEGDVGR
jgi:hypothetical protein